jgi:hypothetical protein
MTDPSFGRPHSRACGIRAHLHGVACHRNCPTCHGDDAFEQLADNPNARVRAAADQLGAALGDAITNAFAKSLANTLLKQRGPGPWLLHADGTITEPTR